VLWQDGPKLIGLGGVLQVEVVPEDDAFGIACLNRGFADGTQFRDEHRNERVAEHVVGEVEFLGEAVAPRFEIFTGANAMQATVHPPRRSTVPIFKAADSKLSVIHAQVAMSTGQPGFTEKLSPYC
jgi:hypothetical protein